MTSICLAKYTPTETQTDQYQYSEPFRFAAPEKYQQTVSEFGGGRGSTLFLEDPATHATIAPDGKSAIEATSFIVKPSINNVFRLKIPEQFTEWCKDKTKFSDSCSYFNMNSGGGGGFF